MYDESKRKHNKSGHYTLKLLAEIPHCALLAVSRSMAPGAMVEETEKRAQANAYASTVGANLPIFHFFFFFFFQLLLLFHGAILFYLIASCTFHSIFINCSLFVFFFFLQFFFILSFFLYLFLMEVLC